MLNVSINYSCRLDLITKLLYQTLYLNVKNCAARHNGAPLDYCLEWSVMHANCGWIF